MSKSTQHPLTREKTMCPIAGQPEELVQNELPTFGAILRAYLWQRHDIKTTAKDPPHKLITESLTSKLINIWQSSSIPIVSRKRIYDMISTLHSQYKSLLKVNKNRRNSDSFKKKLLLFQEKSRQLFDIACCKCTDFEKCTCAKEHKVPQAERPFLIDQRGSRAMVIGGLDKKTTAANIKKIIRQRKDRSSMKKVSTSKNNFENVEPGSSPTSSCTTSDATDFEEELSDRLKLSTKKKKVVRDLPSLGGVCDRIGISNRSAALLATSVLQDHGIISDENKESIIDRHKVSRQRSKSRKTQKDSRPKIPLKALYFDGRKDRTRTQEERGAKKSLNIITEEHIALLQEPGSEFLGHVTPTSGSALNITTAIMKYLEKENIDTAELKAVGCDGTVTNTGLKNGIISCMERILGRPLQWVICLLHENELPLRHLVTSLDGKTSGPTGLTGNIGKQLNDCEKLPVANYAPEQSDYFSTFPNINDLSTDQQYLLDICKAVSQGTCEKSLASRSPGKMSHSRWVTTANRILRLYISTENPSTNLMEIVKFIMHVYSPMWFKIKSEPSIIHGAKHMHETIVRMRSLSVQTQEIVKPILQRNGYFCHPENILIAMVADDISHIRVLGWRRILKARKSKNQGEVRRFKVPPIKFNAQNYFDMIEWQDDITEPPLTKDISETQLEELIKSQEAYQGLTDLPCHTQAVERLIKLVTEASEKVCGEERRDGYIRTTLASRKKMPAYENKAQYKL